MLANKWINSDDDSRTAIVSLTVKMFIVNSQGIVDILVTPSG